MREVRLSVGFVLLLAINVSAQITTGSLQGTVVDSTGNVVPGATVTIVNESTGAERPGVTNDVGDFIFTGLIPAPYTIKVQLEGFKPLEIKNNILQANQRVNVGQLKLEVGSLSESVTVSAQGEYISSSRTSHEAALDLRQVTNLSIRGRDPISLLKILPGVSVAGNSNLAND